MLVRFVLAALAAAVVCGCQDDVVVVDDDDAVACPSGCPDCEPDGTCAATACQGNNDCDRQSFCDPGTGYCRLGCRIGRLCTDGRVCIGETRSCQTCSPALSPCPEGVCVDGRCIVCTDDSMCGGLGSGRICDSFNQCVDGCRGEENCPTDQRCDLTRAMCVECTTDDHCGTGTCDLETGVCR